MNEQMEEKKSRIVIQCSILLADKVNRALVDQVDAKLPNIGGHSWFAKVSNGGIYPARKEYIGDYKQESVLLHNEIAKNMGWRWPSTMTIDHIDRDPLNNARKNLRIATVRMQMMNQAPRIGASGYRGVLRKSSGNYQARITEVDGKRTSLGTYSTAEAASIVYEKAWLQRWEEAVHLRDEELAEFLKLAGAT